MFLLLIIPVLMTVSCGSLRTNMRPAAPDEPMPIVIPTPMEILDAPSQLALNGHFYRLEPRLQRDPDAKSRSLGGLGAEIRLREIDSLPIPPDIHIDFLWVVNGEMTWATPLSPVSPGPPWGSAINASASHGPRWPCGKKVHVVVRVRDWTPHPHIIQAGEVTIRELHRWKWYHSPT
jgi:hypothetical protein